MSPGDEPQGYWNIGKKYSMSTGDEPQEYWNNKIKFHNYFCISDPINSRKCLVIVDKNKNKYRK